MVNFEETYNDVGHIDVNSLLNSRLFVYELLNYFIDKPPDEKFLLELSAYEKFIELAQFSEGGKLIKECTESLTSGNTHLQMNEIRQEYNKLFVGPNPLPAPLWESVFLSDEHLMFGKETILVREVYERFGLTYKNKANKPDDYITVELDFMRFLISNSLMAYQNRNIAAVLHLLDEQSTFLSDHLLKWAPQAFEILLNSTSSMLYQGLALLVIEYLPSDLDIIVTIKEGLFK